MKVWADLLKAWLVIGGRMHAGQWATTHSPTVNSILAIAHPFTSSALAQSTSAEPFLHVLLQGDPRAHATQLGHVSNCGSTCRYH